MAFILCLTICSLLSGCGSSSASEIAEQNNEPVAEDVEPVTEDTEPVAEDVETEKTIDESDFTDPDDIKDTEEGPVRRERDEYVKEYASAADVLYAYKEAQDDPGEDIGYTFYDIDSDGKDELVITYAGEIVEIYGNYGNLMRCAYKATDGHTVTIYPNGMLRDEYSGEEGDSGESWYLYYSSLGDYLRALDKCGDEYYEVCGWDLEGEALKEIEDLYKNYGYYPEWIGEWFDEMTRSQYENCLPKSKPVKLPESEKLSDIVIVGSKADVSDISGKEVSLDAATQKKMNIFMSNFSEAGLGKYDKDDRDLIGILHWTFIWTKINKDKNIERGDVDGKGLCEILSLENVNTVTDKYLGITISDDEAGSLKPDDTYGLFFEKGNLCMPAADGESYTNLTIVDKAEDLGARRLKLTFTVYSQDLDEYFDGKGKDEYYKLSGEEASKDQKLETMWNGYAIVSYDGSAYKLEYLEQK